MMGSSPSSHSSCPLSLFIPCKCDCSSVSGRRVGSTSLVDKTSNLISLTDAPVEGQKDELTFARSHSKIISPIFNLLLKTKD